MNKRAHIRHHVEMPARLILGDEPGRVCQVQDFCLGGMLLALPESGLLPSSNLEPDTSVRLALDVQGLRGMRRVILPARVRRQTGTSVGVAFDHPDSKDLLAVQHHVRALLQKERCGARDPASHPERAGSQSRNAPETEPAPHPKNSPYRTAWRLMQHRDAPAGASHEPGGVLDVPEKTRQTLARALHSIQREGLTGRELHAVVKEIVEERGLGHGHGMALLARAELVRKVVGLLAENPLLEEPLHTAMLALQVPVFRTVLIHQHALDNSGSPLVRLLDLIVALAAQGNTAKALAAAKAFSAINPFNISMLENISHNIHEVVQRADARFQRRAAALISRCQVREQRSKAEHRVNRHLETRLCGRQVPAVVLTLLNAGWRELLIEAVQREGEQGATVEDALDVLERLVQALDQAPAPDELPTLVARIKRGLARTEAQISGTRLGSSLRNLLSPDRRSQATAEAVVLPAGTFEKPAWASCMRADEESKVRHFIESLAPGGWFVLDQQSARRALRFVWASHNQDIFVFNDPTGEVPVEFDRPALAGAVLGNRIQHVPYLSGSPVLSALEAALEQAYRGLSVAARHDPVTGLLTQSELKRRLNSEGGLRGTLIWIEPIHGGATPRPQKEEALQHAGGILKEMFHNRLTARADGQALLLWLAGTGLVASRTAVEAMRRRVHASHQRMPITLSFGLAERQPAHCLDSLLIDARAACRVAATKGGGVQLADVQARSLVSGPFRVSPDAEERVVLQSRHAAPGSGALLPACVVEARLVGADGRDLTPRGFSGSALHHSQMPALDRRMITSLLRWLHKNSPIAKRFDHFLLRLSRLSLRDGGLPEFLHEQFERYSIDPKHLCLEFAETDVAEDLDAARRRMRALKEEGCRLALGGCGLAEVSVSQLRTLPVGILSPDETLIDAVRGPQPHALALIRGLLDIARLAECRTIAHHVPDAKTGERLKNLGMDWVERPASPGGTMPGKLPLSAEPTEMSY